MSLLLMIGVLLISEFQQQTDAQMDDVGDPAANVLSTPISLDTWISLSYSPLVSNSESVTNGSTTYTKSTDYAMNYSDGTILIYGAGTITNTTIVTIDYDHKSGSTHEAYDNIKNSTWGAMNLMSMYPWILGAVAILGVVVLIGHRT